MYPSYYFIKQKSSQQRRTTKDTGVLDVNCVLKGDPAYWVDDSSGELVHLKKTLVINDPTILCWSPYKLYKLQEKLTQLVKDGFSVYLGDDLNTPLSLVNLDVSLARYRGAVALLEDSLLINHAAEALSQPDKNLLCLNYFELNRLLSDDPLPDYSIQLSDLCVDIGAMNSLFFISNITVHESSYQHHCDMHLKKKGDYHPAYLYLLYFLNQYPISVVEHDIRASGTYDYLNRLPLMRGHVTDHLSLSGERLNTLKGRFFGPLFFLSRHSPESEVSGLSMLDCKLSSLLEIDTKELEYLHIHFHNKKYDNLVQPDTMNFSCLTTLILDMDYDGSHKSMQQLVNQMSHLKMLSLRRLHDVFVPPPVSETLELNQIVLDQLIFSDKNIHFKKLVIQDCYLDNDDGLPNLPVLPSLALLQLTGVDILLDEALVKLLIQKAPALTQLDIDVGYLPMIKHLKQQGLIGPHIEITVADAARVIDSVSVYDLRTDDYKKRHSAQFLKAIAHERSLYQDDNEKDRDKNWQSIDDNNAWDTTVKSSIPSQERARRSSDNQLMDADTSLDKDKAFNTKQIFYDASGGAPHVNNYRLRVYSELEVNSNYCMANEAFIIKNTDDEQFSHDAQYKQMKLSEHDLFDSLESSGAAFYGKQQLQLDNQFQALASLTGDETLTAYHIEPKDVAVEIQYSTRDGLYYIRAKDPQVNQRIDIDFLLAIKPPTMVKLPDDVNEIVKLYQSFGEGELTLAGKLSGKDYLNAIKTQRLGACRHRMVACFHELKERFPTVPVRMITNDCHAFLEIKVDGQWVHCDLGGYPAKLMTDKSNQPESVKQTHAVDAVGSCAIADEKSILPRNDIFQEVLEDALFYTWKPLSKSPASLDAYLQSLAKQFSKNQLIQLRDSESVSHLSLQIIAYAHKIKRPVFYVNSPSDLVCSAPYLLLNGHQGTTHPGPGGLLHEFLKKHQDKSNPPMIVVNYDHFDADDIVRFNSILDKNRHADGTALSPEAMVLGLINPKNPNAYRGADFYSRFDAVNQCPWDSKHLYEGLPSQVPETFIPGTDAITLDLFNSPNWKERLLGRWILDDKSLMWCDGLLIQALNKGLPIHIQNGPWDDPDFCLFWREALLTGHIKTDQLKRNGDINEEVVIPLPESFQLYHSEGYAWSSNISYSTDQRVAGTPILNANQMVSFFDHYEISEDSTIHYAKGILEHHEGQSITVYVSAPLSDDQWAQFLSECTRFKIQLTLQLAPHVAKPGEPSIEYQDNTIKADELLSLEHSNVVVSDDIDLSVQQIQTTPKAWVIDVSECDACDLFKKINGSYDKSTREFTFDTRASFLEQALNDGKSIVLKGHFSDELVDALAPLILRRQYETPPQGMLTIITDHDDKRFSFYQARQRHVVSTQAKYKALLAAYPGQELLIQSIVNACDADEPYVKLSSRVQYFLQSGPSHVPDVAAYKTASDLNWRGLSSVPKPVLGDISLVNSKEVAQGFVDERMAAVSRVLENAPFVFLTGLTGVGKSSFIEKHWPNSTRTLYVGEATIEAWLSDKSEHEKTLFIDEANMSSNHWSQFEGLFNDPPSLFLNGQRHELTPQHKVIFAGNPASYGGERTTASLFKRHGHCCLFEPMPAAFIYQQILLPLFVGADNAIEPEPLSLHFLRLYQFFTEIESDQVLMTARELSSMALLTVNYCRRHPHALPMDVAHYYAYQIARSLLPVNRPDLLETFNKQFPAPQFSPEQMEGSKGDYLFTSSRLAIKQHLDDYLHLRHFKQKEASNDKQRFSGLNAIVIEGEPGIGKSELITHCLVEQHKMTEKTYCVDVPHASEISDTGIFYRMPASMGLSEKEALLLHAFNEGCVVVVDEINSSPLMERLLNELLMGTHNGTPAKKPGFMIIGTQNPSSMEGREQASNALARRTASFILEPYHEAEMTEILIHQGLPPAKSQALIASFMHASKKAASEHLTPAPTFRDLQRIAALIREHPSKTSSCIELSGDKSEQDQKGIIQSFKDRLDQIRPKETPGKGNFYG